MQYTLIDFVHLYYKVMTLNVLELISLKATTFRESDSLARQGARDLVVVSNGGGARG
jgi:hypothetical protein